MNYKKFVLMYVATKSTDYWFAILRFNLSIIKNCFSLKSRAECKNKIGQLDIMIEGNVGFSKKAKIKRANKKVAIKLKHEIKPIYKL